MMETRGLVHSAIFDFCTLTEAVCSRSLPKFLKNSDRNSYEISLRIIFEFYCRLLLCALYAISLHFRFGTFQLVGILSEKLMATEFC